MKNNIPERSCVVCRKKGEKSQFLKVVLNKNGEIDIEKQKKLDGRGAYICKTADCISKCSKTKALNRAFKTNVGAEIYSKLENEIGTKQS